MQSVNQNGQAPKITLDGEEIRVHAGRNGLRSGDACG